MTYGLRWNVLSFSLSTLWLVNAASAQSPPEPTIIDQHADDISVVIQFAEQFKAPQGADFRKLKRLEKEIVRRKLLTAGELVNVKEETASLGMRLYSLAAMDAPVKPFHFRVPRDKGPMDVVAYHKYLYLLRYLNYYFFDVSKVVGFREADFCKAMAPDQLQPRVSRRRHNLGRLVPALRLRRHPLPDHGRRTVAPCAAAIGGRCLDPQACYLELRRNSIPSACWIAMSSAVTCDNCGSVFCCCTNTAHGMEVQKVTAVPLDEPC